METNLTILCRGFAIGFALAAPVGPISILVIRRSLVDGARSGLASGLGAAVADAVFALVGAIGFASLSCLGGIVDGRPLRLIGALLLIALGARTLFSRAPTPGRRVGVASVASSYRRAFATTLLYTLASPVSILSFAAVAASLGGDASSSVVRVVLLASGVFVGSMTWWTLLSSGVAALRSRVSDRAMAWANRAAGGALVAFGAVALLPAL